MKGSGMCDVSSRITRFARASHASSPDSLLRPDVPKQQELMFRDQDICVLVSDALEE